MLVDLTNIIYATPLAERVCEVTETLLMCYDLVGGCFRPLHEPRDESLDDLLPGPDRQRLDRHAGGPEEGREGKRVELGGGGGIEMKR